jgi:tryptophanyl-tRNA synthetase
MRILSGIQTSGELHIGNYFGAIRQHVAFQERGDAIYFLADYHSMTSIRDTEARRRLTRDIALDYLACGLNPERAVLYRQSDLPEVCELSWILSTLTPMGLLERAHAYKDKLAQGQSADHGLFAYPVLMAADILIHNADVVPVGQDQKQHVEMTRDIAQRFNNTYGEVFTLPEPRIEEDADSKPVEDPKDFGANLFQLWKLFADESDREQMKQRAAAAGLGYGEVKQDLLKRLLAFFGSMRERRVELEKRPDEVEAILADGAHRARETAAPVMAAVRAAAGLGPAKEIGHSVPPRR